MKIDKLKLRMRKPILVNSEFQIYVHQPLFDDVVDIGEDTFNSYCLPYLITKDSMIGDSDEGSDLLDKFSLFQMFFVKTEEDEYVLDRFFGGSTATLLEDSLKYFLKVEDVRILEMRKSIVIDGKYLLNSAEFEKVRKAIQAVTAKKDLEIEKPPKNMTDRQMDIWKKLQKGRKRRAEKESISLQDIVNYISFGGESFISTDQIRDMTFYEFTNAYKSIIKKDTYKSSLDHHLSTKFDVKDKISHWTETLKIGK